MRRKQNRKDKKNLWRREKKKESREREDNWAQRTLLRGLGKKYGSHGVEYVAGESFGNSRAGDGEAVEGDFLLHLDDRQKCGD